MKTSSNKRSVHLSEGLHRQAKLEAVKQGKRLGEFVEQAVVAALKTKTNERGRAA